MGRIDGMDAARYHAINAVSNSALSAMNRSPFHYWAEYLNPDRPAKESTPSMRAGTLLHALVLEPETISARYVVRPEDIDPRTKAGKEWAEAYKGREIISADQWATAKAQRDALLSVQDIADVLKRGAAEVSFFWVDQDTGVHCKARADFVHPLPDGRVILLDLKTTPDASPDSFGRSVWNFGYHRQDAWYSRGYELATGVEVAGFLFGAVTGSYPFVAVPYSLDDQARWQGQQECDELLAKYLECRASSHWPAHGEGVQLLSLPRWAQREMEPEVAYV